VAVVRAYLAQASQNQAIWAGSWVLAAAVLLFWPSAEKRGTRHRRWDWHANAAKPAAVEGGAS
jgi:hypothetical protein